MSERSTVHRVHLILPTRSPAEQPNYEFGLYHLSVRNVAKWSSPVQCGSPEVPEAWHVVLRLAGMFMGRPDRPAVEIDESVFRQFAGGVVKRGDWPGLTVDEMAAALEGTVGPERVIDMLLRLGPYGDGFGRRPGGLTLKAVRDAPHGIDLGALEPQLREILNTKSGLIELAPRTMIDDLARLHAHMATRSGGFVLIGRRDLRASNSFMHNLPALVKGPERCTLQIARADAARLGLSHGAAACVASRVGHLVAQVEVTDDLMPGVVSLPHGWGHDVDDARLTVARAHAGVNTNILTDDRPTTRRAAPRSCSVPRSPWRRSRAQCSGPRRRRSHCCASGPAPRTGDEIVT